MALKNAYIEKFHALSFEELNQEALKIEAQLKALKHKRYVLGLIRAGKRAEVINDGRS